MMEWNVKLQELRKQKGLTQEELAQALYVSRAAVSKWESGRGYPSIDSLKAIASFFSVTLDQLLYAEETLAASAEVPKEKSSGDLLWGLMDLSIITLLFLPFFGQTAEGRVLEVCLLSLTEVQPYLRAAFMTVVFGMALSGILTLALQNCGTSLWLKAKRKTSFALHIAGVLLFIISRQPYAAVFLLILLIIKGGMLLRKQ